MNGVARLALSTGSTGCEHDPAGLAVLGGLARAGVRVQHFGPRACPEGSPTIRALTGLPGRHLDAWLMPPAVCREVFARGTRHANLAVVEGRLAPTATADPGGLAPLARALALPVVAVVPCRGWDEYHLPTLAPEVDAVILDGLERPGDYPRLQRLFSVLARRPVLGAVEALPDARTALGRVSTGDASAPDLALPFVESFLRFADLPSMVELATSRPMPDVSIDWRTPSARRFRVAFARDEAFGAYFPDTLETLEAQGADLVEFSPLKHDRLPPDVELVLIGCGRPERFAERLASNASLIGSLRLHVCEGRRIYAEGGGTAYLCRRMLVGGRAVPGADILPVDAEFRGHPCPSRPAARTLRLDSWLGPEGAELRGYRSGRWRLRATAESAERGARSGPLTDAGDIYRHHHAIGSLLHLHPAALPELAAAWAGPHRPSLVLPERRR